MVSVGSEVTRAGLTAALIAVLGVGACVGRPRSPANIGSPEPRSDVLQFDNQATTYVDVYLAGGQLQWRLGRVPPGVRANLRVPESAVGWTTGFVQLVVIAGSQVSAEAARDPRAILAIPQPVSEVLSQRWTFRQPTGAGLQLQATRLPGR